MKATFHVLYWEGGDPVSVSLKSHGAPSLCKQCDGVRRPWRFRLDNLFASIRSCGKEGGVFRKELVDFTCLSPCSAIRYDLRSFHHWLIDENTKALTEQNVLGTAIKVDRGLLDSRDCGVHTEDLRDGQWSQWLASHAAAMQQSAADRGGRCVALLLDQAGVELLTLDTGGAPAQRKRPCAPIAKVLLVLGGPSGIQPAVYQGMAEVLRRAQLEVLEIRLPGGLQHSNVVLADLLMGHDRGFLLPAVEDLLELGRQQYEEWRAAVQQHLAALRAEAMQGPAPLRQQLARLRGAPRQQPSVRRRDLDTQLRWTEVLLAPQPQERRELPPEQQLLELVAAHPHLLQQLQHLQPPHAEQQLAPAGACTRACASTCPASCSGCRLARLRPGRSGGRSATAAGGAGRAEHASGAGGGLGSGPARRGRGCSRVRHPVQRLRAGQAERPARRARRLVLRRVLAPVPRGGGRGGARSEPAARGVGAGTGQRPQPGGPRGPRGGLLRGAAARRWGGAGPPARGGGGATEERSRASGHRGPQARRPRGAEAGRRRRLGRLARAGVCRLRRGEAQRQGRRARRLVL
ncbi:unnamed protein product [Prorocentrum cordatum]|uniref:Uncharacterized protein n=1 Tax=Prorocentrum cordatum TaxID=2364126 RepID=A0ABN9UQ07_9DINO|nr:unnamed protein product [Polarella glacialis]